MELTPKTRKEVFLAAAGGQDVTTPTPITREEVFLDEIAKGGGGSSLPSTETASAGDVLSLDDNKEPQWAAPSGSGGGVLVVGVTETELPNGNIGLTLNKTWQEIHDADYPVLKHSYEDVINYMTVLGTSGFDADYVILADAGESTFQFSCASASEYPSTEIEP